MIFFQILRDNGLQTDYNYSNFLMGWFLEKLLVLGILQLNLLEIKTFGLVLEFEILLCSIFGL